MEFTVLGCQSVFVCPLKLGVEIFLFIFYEILSLKKKKCFKHLKGGSMGITDGQRKFSPANLGYNYTVPLGFLLWEIQVTFPGESQL